MGDRHPVRAAGLARATTNVWVLYALVAVWNGAFGVASPARQSIYPRILTTRLLPAANALSVFAMNASLTVGPLMAGVLVDWGGFATAYTVDALDHDRLRCGGSGGCRPCRPSRTRTAPRPPGRACARCSTASASCATRPNVRMTFVADIAAMLLAQPRVLFPAAGAVIFGGGAKTVG